MVPMIDYVQVPDIDYVHYRHMCPILPRKANSDALMLRVRCGGGSRGERKAVGGTPGIVQSPQNANQN